MSPLRLPPMWADELPAALTTWFFAPTASWLIQRDPKLDEVRLIGIMEDTPRLELRPSRPRAAWALQVREAFAAALDARPDALDADPQLLKHLAPALPPGETLLATARRGRPYYKGQGWNVETSWVGPELQPAAPSKPPEGLDPEVAELLAGLQAMDDADVLALRLLEVLTLLDEGASARAEATLRAILDFRH